MADEEGVLEFGRRTGVGPLIQVLRQRAVIVALSLLLTGAVLSFWNMQRLQNRLVQVLAARHGERVLDAVVQFRRAYTSEVVGRAAAAGMEITHDYASRPHALPLPATLTMDLGRRLSRDGEELRFYSPYPFPWRAAQGGLRDDFARTAWDHLRLYPETIYRRLEEGPAGPVMRLARADIMGDACVSCHNQHPDTPRRGWKTGDVRGILEIMVPMQEAKRATAGLMLESRLTMVVLLLGGASGLVIILLKFGRTSMDEARKSILFSQLNATLDEEVQRRTHLLEASQVMMRAILDGAYAAILTVDEVGRIESANRQGGKMFGYAEAEMVGLEFPEILVCDDGWGFMESLAAALKAEEAIEREVVGRRRDGSGFPVDLALSHGRIGQRRLWVVMARDKTERKAMELQMAQAHKMESIGQLAAGIAHEINTPTQFVGDNVRFLADAFGSLQAVIARVQDLEPAAGEPDRLQRAAVAALQALISADHEFLVAEVPKAIEQSLEGIGRIATIVRAMKDFSHPGEGKVATDLNRAVESTVTVARSEWKYVARLSTDLGPGLDRVPCLAGEFKQVILNLVVNASHAIAEVVGDGSQRQGEITITTRRAEPWAEIRVRDTGAGMPEHVRRRIFDPFFTTKAVGRGTGQGLSLAHAVIVSKHGGTIEVESEEGSGSTFILRLPLDLEQARETSGGEA